MSIFSAFGKVKGPFAVRAATRGDIPQLERIETVGVSDPWSARAMTEYGELPDTVMLVAGRAGTNQIAGWMGYVPLEHSIHISRIVVDPLWRRKGIGGLMIDGLLAGMEATADRRPVEFIIPDTAVSIHLLLKKYKFRAVTMYRRLNGGNSYRFVWDGGEDL